MTFQFRKEDFFPEVLTPTLMIREKRVRQNIQKMAAKARKSGTCFRPHFKTHQSAIVGKWFQEAGIDCITVSSVTMAGYFAKQGWQDITIAFPVNIRQIQPINQLAEQIRLGLLVESLESVLFLAENLSHEVDIWIKIDTGYHRTGIPWNESQSIIALARQVHQSQYLKLKGLLTHSGHTYGIKSYPEVRKIYNDTVNKLQTARNILTSNGIQAIQISLGDTPAMSVVDDFSKVEEIRPGNFVFYDVMQLENGICSEDEIGAAVACPVVAKHPARCEIIIYGGAVHLSKEAIVKDPARCFGRVALPAIDGWGALLEHTCVASVSQEHGIIRTEPEIIEKIQIGDILMVLPIHSCLAVNLLKEYCIV